MAVLARCGEMCCALIDRVDRPVLAQVTLVALLLASSAWSEGAQGLWRTGRALQLFFLVRLGAVAVGLPALVRYWINMVGWALLLTRLVNDLDLAPPSPEDSFADL
jgi:hypothetical protein